MDVEEVIRRGQRAQQVLTDPLVEDALQSIIMAITQLWAESNDTSTREELWYSLQGVHRFTNYFEQAIENGEFEKAQLEDIRNAN